MRWFVNDHSLEGRFATAGECANAFKELARIRSNSRVLREYLACSRNLINCKVCPDDTLLGALGLLPYAIKGLILSWIAKNGPFVEDERTPEHDDYYEFQALDVTDGGLGEATRRIQNGSTSGVFSFPVDGTPDFKVDPLGVQHGLAEEVLGNYNVPNVWALELLEGRIGSDLGPPTSWAELAERCSQRFEHLWFSPGAFDPVARLAFYPAVANRALMLFAIMNEYASGLLPDGGRTAASAELYEKYCVGENAIFSGEADGNIAKFRTELTFADPDAGGTGMFCPWHGKIKTQQFRVHFECPKLDSTVIRVFYIGPKITRR